MRNFSNQMESLIVRYENHVGTWGQRIDIGGLGVVLGNEFQFHEDGRFRWDTLRERARGESLIVSRQGMWKLVDGTIQLQIDQSDEPEVEPKHRCDLKILDRDDRLMVQEVRRDDQVVSRGGTSYALLQAGEADRSLQAALKKRRPTKKSR